MQTTIYLVCPIWSGVPLTVLARDQPRATSLFARWCRLHAPSLSAEPYSVTEADWFFTDDHPSLVQAAKDGQAGVAYWQGFEIGWKVAAPNKRHLGLLAPPEPAVKPYQMYVSDGEDALVFAYSGADAVLMFTDYHERAYGHRPRRFECCESDVWSLGEERTALRQDLLKGGTGIAGQDDDGVWRIYPIDDKRAGNINPFNR